MSKGYQKYVCGFLTFTLPGSEEKRVVLVHKNRPKWQAGKFNGVGGKVEFGESPTQAMIREFAEEAGIVGGIQWKLFAELNGPDYTVLYYTAFLPNWTPAYEATTDEAITDHSINNLPEMVSPSKQLLEMIDHNYYTIINDQRTDRAKD